jgi:P-type Ca2+ transporter type 2C
VGGRYVGVPAQEIQTVAFLAIAFAQLWHVFNVRSEDSPLLVNEVTRNRYVWGAMALSIVLTCFLVYFEPTRIAFALKRPGLPGWLLALGVSLVPLLGNLLYTLVVSLHGKDGQDEPD